MAQLSHPELLMLVPFRDSHTPAPLGDTEATSEFRTEQDVVSRIYPPLHVKSDNDDETVLIETTP